MAGKYISDLDQKKHINGKMSLIAQDGDQTVRIEVDNIADEIWENMYYKARRVIVTCSHCLSANAITNSNCIQCGAPLGKVIENRSE